MKFIPLRSAVIAGTCAVALSFVSLPAFADTTGIGAGGDTTTTAQVDTSTASTSTTDATATSSDEATPEPVESEPSDDQTAGPSDTETTAPALPAEQGHPKQAFQQTVFLPKGIAKNGIHVKYSGLTPKATYQPFYSGGDSGGTLGSAKRANAHGVINFVYHFAKSEKWATTLGATYDIGLIGLDTQFRIERTVEVKYDSDVSLTTARHGKKVDLSVKVEKAGKSGRNTAWSHVAVHFEKKVGTKWVTVETVKTNTKGLAKATVKAGKSLWRAVVASGTTVAGTTTAAHTK